MKTKLLLLLVLANFSIYAQQYTSIPDINFEKKLISLRIDSGTADGKVLTANVAKVISLDVAYSSISDLTGIQDFVALKDFRCANNQISKLDLSKNLTLTSLDCTENLLSTVDVSKNLNLEELRCGSNQLTALDISKNISLTILYCSNNKLKALDVSKNLALYYLICSSNQITALDVSNNIDLAIFYCEGNKLKSLNFKNGNKNLLKNNSVNFIRNPTLTCIEVDDTAYANANWFTNKDATATFNTVCIPYTLIPDPIFEAKLIALDIDKDGMNGFVVTSSINTIKELNLSNAGITNLSGIEDFAQLENLNCSGNNYTKIDFSKNFNLKTIDLSKNANLESIDLRNGKNTLLSAIDFKLNPVLRCIQVDDVDFATNTWSNFKDNYTSFSTDCTIYTLIPDPKFEAKLITMGIDQDGLNGKVATENIATLKSLSVSNSSISDLTGIQDFVALTSLYCDNNQITKLDLSKNVDLTNIRCNNNQITTINISKSLSLNTLFCNNNKLTTIDVSKNSMLKELRCQSNQITTIDISNNTALTYLYCFNNKLTALDVSKNLDLYYLYCSGNQIETLNVSKNAALGFLDCYNNKFTALDISKNLSLYYLNCELNQIPTLDVSHNPELHTLYCNNNKLTTLDVSKNLLLNRLNCRSNQITTLDVTNNLVLGFLECYENKLTVLDVSKNVSLNYLNCRLNQLSTLDVSKNPALTYIYCNSNKLTALNLKNGKNTNLLANDFTNNPSLTCIQVDDVTYSNTNWAKMKDATSEYNVNCSLYTLIPDLNFENKLIKLGIDSGTADGQVLTAKISKIESIDLQFSSISDLKGIEDFVSLKTLNCYSNNLKSLDLSQNVLLENLRCETNQIGQLILNKNTNLKNLECGSNLLTSLDVSNNKKLLYISCYQNQLTKIDISNNVAITELYASKNKLSSLDSSHNPLLNYLYCEENVLQNLDVSKNPDLIILYCQKNQISSLDLSANKKLTVPLCSYNNLTSLNLKNGNNTAFHTSMNFSNNPNLTCIEVDNPDYSNTNWLTKKDAQATYSNDCGTTYTLIADTNFEQKLINLGIDTDGLNGKTSTADISKLTSLDLSNSNISDLSGIEKFTSLTYLDVSNNKLTSLDLNKNLLLETLNASSNQLTTLDLSKNTKLRIVYVVNNPLVSLNLRNGNNANFILPSKTGKKADSVIQTSFLGLKTLGCIQVDNENYSNTNWSNIKEPTTVYANTCKSLGVDESTINQAILYPNPTKGEVNINNVSLEKATIYNSLGQLVKSFTLNAANTNNTINLSGLPKGVYYIYLINGDAASAKKIIIE